MSDPIQSIARHLGIQTFGDGLLAKIGQTIDLLQEAARNRADLAAECERLQREAKNDAIAYKAAIERQNEIRTERDAALAELAALKGGQEAVAEVYSITKSAGSVYFSAPAVRLLRRNIAPGTKLYTAPPAQASAWAADDLRIAMQQRDHYAARVEALELGLLQIADDFYPHNDSEMALALGEMREAIRSLVTDAAPTPGASDGKGGAHDD